MIFQVIKGASYALKGCSLLKLPGVKRYVLLPTLINLLLFSAAIWYGSEQFDQLLEHFLPNWLAWLEFILWPLFFVASLLIVFFTFTLIANVLGAPFNGVLAAKIEEQLTKEKLSTEEGYIELLRSAKIGMSNAIKKLLYILVRIIPLLLLFLIPGINILAPFLMFIFGAWMLAIEYLDYPIGNRNLPFKQQLQLMKEQRLVCFGLGMALFAMTIVPILNFFVMPVGVAAATALWVDQFRDINQNLAPQKQVL